LIWTLSPKVDLRNDRVSAADADRQQHTAAEILKRLNDQPGLILADEVGMGKTYVALAVAVSVLESTQRRKSVVVMVPSAVADKWPTEWAVFAERCLPADHGLRASKTVRRGSDFLKLLDDPAATRSHLIFMTHGALTGNLHDPFMRLALLHRAMLRRRNVDTLHLAVARSARSLLNDNRFDEELARELLQTPIQRWREVWELHRPNDPLDDDPVPQDLGRTLHNVDVTALREALDEIPRRQTATFAARLRTARRQINQALNHIWLQCLKGLDNRLPLLILDEAHHVKNPNRLARLFDNEEAEQDADALQGPLGNIFENMLFLTATPFQLGHHELLQVLSRFEGVRWPSALARRSFDQQMDTLRCALDRAQGSALRLERAWARIDPLDSTIVEALTSFEPQDSQPEALRSALQIAVDAGKDIEDAETLLRPWVIRHVKPDRAERRLYRPGKTVLDDVMSNSGIPVAGAATLPFLLAARAQAIASLQGNDGEKATRRYFAYGLASSFETYADTRRNRVAELDDVADDNQSPVEINKQLRWYLDRITAALPDEAHDSWVSHPKVQATVRRVRELWRNGEKVLVFCFYVETGRALRAHISRSLREEVLRRAAEGLRLNPADETAVLEELDRIGDRLLRVDSRGYASFRTKIRSLLTEFDDATRDQVADVAIRFMRTPSFLVRYVDLSRTTKVDDLLAGLDRTMSGTTLTDRIRSFADTLNRKVEQERSEILQALTGIQTGGIVSTAADFDPSERSLRREILMPNVRLANGSVRQETRRRLMLAFNTPFFPEVLVASSVMSEGVDLQHDCRYVIHHDLDWNPSTLEQRTGRIDRIGSKAEAVRQPVVIYEPYIGGTHDEKMFRVVKDRERWFGVVMGQTSESDELATDRQEDRIPLPAQLAQRLTMDLSLGSRR
jgi:superfamily II DNA or RNA helicase